MNLEQSNKHRSLDDYLINKERWHQEKEQLLERAGLTELVDPKKVLIRLDKVLFEQYRTTNTNSLAGKNPYLKILKNGHFRIATPALEEKDSDPLRQLFPERHYVPLSEVLVTVNLHCAFLDEMQHWQQRHIRTTVAYRIIYAGVMALGCGIGTHKMGHPFFLKLSGIFSCVILFINGRSTLSLLNKSFGVHCFQPISILKSTACKYGRKKHIVFYHFFLLFNSLPQNNN